MKIGLIGCGKQAPKHISGLKAVGDVEVAVCDIDSSRANALAAEHGLESYQTVAEMFDDPDVVGIDIATPTLTHSELIYQAIESGKHFFCEKPLSEDLDSSRTIADRLKQTGLIGMVGYIYRFAPVLEVGHSLVSRDQKGELPLGNPVCASFRIGGRGDHEVWKHQTATAGGAMSEMLVHMLDLAVWYFGGIEHARLLRSDLRRPVRTIRGQEVEVDAEDYVLAEFRTDGGMELLIQADLLTPAFSQYVDIQFERGSFMGSIQADFPSYVFASQATDAFPAGKTNLEFEPTNLFERQMAEFCRAVRDGNQVDRNRVSDSVEIATALQKLTSK